MMKFYAGAAAAVVVAALGGTILYTQFANPQSCAAGATVAGADIGGPFELVSESGGMVTDAEVITEPTLVYFGYTFCPDICPLDVARNASAVDLLAERGHEVRPVFVTVDPARDTPEVLAEFTDHMHPEMIGLTGSDEQVKAAADAYRVYFSRSGEDPDYYLMNHSTFTYLMLPEQGFSGFFRRDAAPEEIAEQVACVLEA